MDHFPAMDASDCSAPSVTGAHQLTKLGPSTALPLHPTDSSPISSVAPALARRHVFARTASSLHHSFVAGSPLADKPVGTDHDDTTLDNGILPPPSPHSSRNPPRLDHIRTDLFCTAHQLSALSPSSLGDGPSDKMMDDDSITSTPPTSHIRTTQRTGRTSSASPSLTSTPLDVRRVRMKQRNRSLTGQCSPRPTMIASSPRRGVSDSHMSPVSRRGSLSAYTRNLQISTGHDSDVTEEEGRSSPRLGRRDVIRHRGLLPKSHAFSRISAELIRESRPGLTEERGEGHVWRSKVQSSVVSTTGRSVSAGSQLHAHINPYSPHWGPARASYPVGTLGALPSFSQSTVMLSNNEKDSFASLFSPVHEPRSVPEPPVPSAKLLNLMLNKVRNRSLVVSTTDLRPGSPIPLSSPKTPISWSENVPPTGSDGVSALGLATADENAIISDNPASDRCRLSLTPRKQVRPTGRVSVKRAREDDTVLPVLKRRAISPA